MTVWPCTRAARLYAELMVKVITTGMCSIIAAHILVAKPEITIMEKTIQWDGSFGVRPFCSQRT